MNLHGIVRGLIASVNPDETALLRLCSGYGTDDAGRRVPTYVSPDVPVQVQVQDLSQKDVQHLDSLNVQGSQKVMYLYGSVEGMNRQDGKGNDLILLKNGTELWSVTAVLEGWPDWCKAAVTRQKNT